MADQDTKCARLAAAAPRSYDISHPFVSKSYRRARRRLLLHCARQAEIDFAHLAKEDLDQLSFGHQVKLPNAPKGDFDYTYANQLSFGHHAQLPNAPQGDFGNTYANQLSFGHHAQLPNAPAGEDAERRRFGHRAREQEDIDDDVDQQSSDQPDTTEGDADGVIGRAPEEAGARLALINESFASFVSWAFEEMAQFNHREQSLNAGFASFAAWAFEEMAPCRAPPMAETSMQTAPPSTKDAATAANFTAEVSWLDVVYDIVVEENWDEFEVNDVLDILDERAQAAIQQWLALDVWQHRRGVYTWRADLHAALRG